MKEKEMSNATKTGLLLLILGTTSFSNHELLGDIVVLVGGMILLYGSIRARLEKESLSEC